MTYWVQNSQNSLPSVSTSCGLLAVDEHRELFVEQLKIAGITSDNCFENFFPGKTEFGETQFVWLDATDITGPMLAQRTARCLQEEPLKCSESPPFFSSLGNQIWPSRTNDQPLNWIRELLGDNILFETAWTFQLKHVSINCCTACTMIFRNF